MNSDIRNTLVELDGEIERKKVGVGVIVRRQGKVLLGKRRGSIGAGTWAFPGGGLGMHSRIDRFAIMLERPEIGALRELLEETGLQGKNPQIVGRTEVFNDELNQDLISIFVLVDIDENEQPKVLEPHRCEEWGWFYWNHLPYPLFQPLQALVSSGYVPPDVLQTA